MYRKQFAVLGAFIGWSAVILQLYLLLENRTTSIPEALVRFFSFFTILTNSWVAICFTAILIAGRNSFSNKPSVLTATAIYILVVGIVYNLVLRFTWNPQGLQKIVDEALHSFTPLYFFIFWWLYVKANSIEWKAAFSWLLYPLVYLTYIMLRGVSSGFYPYPFVNVADLGYAKVAINAVMLMVAFLLLSFTVIAIGKWKERGNYNLRSSTP